MEAVADGEPGSSNSSSEETDEKMFDELACQLGSKSENLAPYTVRNDVSHLIFHQALNFVFNFYLLFSIFLILIPGIVLMYLGSVLSQSTCILKDCLTFFLD